jgi:imidazolonepropionase-like amidohydrolase
MRLVRPGKSILNIIICLCALAQSSPAQSKRTVIAASTILDGKGYVLRKTRIVVEGSKIVSIDPHAGPVDFDLTGLTVLPGWIDSHVREF